MCAPQFVIKVIFEIGYIKGARKAPLQIGYFTLNYVGASSARPHILEKHQLFLLWYEWGRVFIMHQVLIGIEAKVWPKRNTSWRMGRGDQ